MSPRATRITTLLQQHFTPIKLEVRDDSALHAGHAGAQPGGETHYSIVMVAQPFAGKTRIARSREVHALLAEEFNSGLHALALTLRTPDEQARLHIPPG